jgi:hypothetical protein
MVIETDDAVNLFDFVVPHCVQNDCRSRKYRRTVRVGCGNAKQFDACTNKRST